jgi:hypothetical protein
LDLSEDGAGAQQAPGRRDDQQWSHESKHRGNRREARWHAPFKERVATASTDADQLCGDLAWCEPIEHRSIPPVVHAARTKNQQQ